MPSSLKLNHGKSPWRVSARRTTPQIFWWSTPSSCTSRCLSEGCPGLLSSCPAIWLIPVQRGNDAPLGDEIVKAAGAVSILDDSLAKKICMLDVCAAAWSAGAWDRSSRCGQCQRDQVQGALPQTLHEELGHQPLSPNPLFWSVVITLASGRHSSLFSVPELGKIRQQNRRWRTLRRRLAPHMAGDPRHFLIRCRIRRPEGNDLALAWGCGKPDGKRGKRTLRWPVVAAFQPLPWEGMETGNDEGGGTTTFPGPLIQNSG